MAPTFITVIRLSFLSLSAGCLNIYHYQQIVFIFITFSRFSLFLFITLSRLSLHLLLSTGCFYMYHCQQVVFIFITFNPSFYIYNRQHVVFTLSLSAGCLFYIYSFRPRFSHKISTRRATVSLFNHS